MTTTTPTPTRPALTAYLLLLAGESLADGETGRPFLPRGQWGTVESRVVPVTAFVDVFRGRTFVRAVAVRLTTREARDEAERLAGGAE